MPPRNAPGVSNAVYRSSPSSALFYGLGAVFFAALFGLVAVMQRPVSVPFGLLFVFGLAYFAMDAGYGLSLAGLVWPPRNAPLPILNGFLISTFGYLLAAAAVEGLRISSWLRPLCLTLALLSAASVLLIAVLSHCRLMSMGTVLLFGMVSAHVCIMGSWVCQQGGRSIRGLTVLLASTTLTAAAAGLLVLSGAIADWPLESTSRLPLMVISVAAMITVAVHRVGFRDIRERALQRALVEAKRDVEKHRLLLQEERTFSRARELAVLQRRASSQGVHDWVDPLKSLRAALEPIVREKNPGRYKRLLDAFDCIERLRAAHLIVPPSHAEALAKADCHPVNVLLNSAARMFAEDAREKGLELRVVRSSVYFSGKPVLVLRILAHFLAQAISGTDRGGVVVGCRRCANHVRIEVYHTGTVVPGEGLDRSLDGCSETEKPESEEREAARVSELAKSQGWRIETGYWHRHGARFALTLPAGS